MNEEEIGKAYARQISSKGGSTTKKRYGKEHFSKIGKQGATKRWSKSNVSDES